MTPTKYMSIFLCLLILSIHSLAQSDNMAKDIKWNVNLSAKQQQQANEIVAKAKPEIDALRTSLNDKMSKLKHFHYADTDDHEKLVQLGQQLQVERKALRSALKKLDDELIKKVGVTLKGYRGRDCNNLTKQSKMKDASIVKHFVPIPHHAN